MRCRPLSAPLFLSLSFTLDPVLFHRKAEHLSLPLHPIISGLVTFFLLSFFHFVLKTGGLEGLRFDACKNLIGPVVEGTVVPNGARVPGTPYELDPIRAAFNIGTMIRWLDYNG